MALRNYEREVKFYRDIAPTVDIRVARCYHGEWDPSDHDFVLLLEDLDVGALANELVRFPFARLVHTTLPDSSMRRLEEALGHEAVSRGSDTDSAADGLPQPPD